MELFWKVYFAVCGAMWLGGALRAWLGMRRVPHLRDVPPLPDGQCPSVAILFAARDEAAKLPAALPTLLSQDYPDYSVVAVDDRSTDGTARILDEFAERDSKLTALHVAELPSGWLGKPHALNLAAQQAHADWFAFTDADVRFDRELLRRAVSLAVERNWDFLTLLGPVEMGTVGERVMLPFFALGFTLGFQPWRVPDTTSGAYLGVGAFQLIRRPVYEAIGTHCRLKMEVIDDMGLGKLVKLGGFRPGIALNDGLARIRWMEGLRNVIRGLTKNVFAAANFSVPRTSAQIAAVLAMSTVPWVGLLFGNNAVRLWALFPVAVTALAHGAIAIHLGASPLYALTHPLGALLTVYLLARSAAVTLVRGGVRWRGTFYPLKELRKGRV